MADLPVRQVVSRLLAALVVALAFVGWQDPLPFQDQLGSDGSTAVIGLAGAAIALIAASRATKYMRWPLWAATICGLTVALSTLPFNVSAGSSMEYVAVIVAFAFLTLMGLAAAAALFISILPLPGSQK